MLRCRASASPNPLTDEDYGCETGTEKTRRCDGPLTIRHSYRFGPRLTTRLTLLPPGSTAPNLGFCEITRRLLTNLA